MKIAIKFGDNDFHSTWRPLMETLYSAYKYQGKLPDNKTDLLNIINRISYGFYLMFQNQFEYNEEVGREESHTKGYLTIDESKLLLNEEVDDYLESISEWDGDNWSTFILDTELYDNNVYIV